MWCRACEPVSPFVTTLTTPARRTTPNATRCTTVPVKRHRGGAGTHTERTQDTRAHKGTRVTPTNLKTIQPSKSTNVRCVCGLRSCVAVLRVSCDCVLELVCRVRFARVSCPWLRFGKSTNTQPSTRTTVQYCTNRGGSGVQHSSIKTSHGRIFRRETLEERHRSARAPCSMWTSDGSYERWARRLVTGTTLFLMFHASTFRSFLPRCRNQYPRSGWSTQRPPSQHCARS